MVACALNANYYSNEFYSSAAIKEDYRINFANNEDYSSSSEKITGAFSLWKTTLVENIKKGDLVIYFGTAVPYCMRFAV